MQSNGKKNAKEKSEIRHLALLCGCAGLGSLCAVLGTTLHTVCGSLGIKDAADDVVLQGHAFFQ